MSERATPTIGRQVDFGPGVLVAAVAVLVLLLAALLPWTGTGATGWEVVLGTPIGSGLPRLFGLFAGLFGVLGTVASIVTRRWSVVFVTAAGSTVTSVTGVWAVWSQNTAGATGPGAGLVLALVATVVLAFRWSGYVFTRQ